MPGTTDLATAYELAAQWHDKHSRGAREIADDEPRIEADTRRRADEAAKHHAACAAGLRLAATREKRLLLTSLN